MDINTSPAMPSCAAAGTNTYHESYLGYVLPYLATTDLYCVTALNKEIEAFCEQEWKIRVAERFGALRYPAMSYRRVYAMRCHFQRRVSSNVSARVYLMNTNGDTSFFRIDSSKPIMCSRERAAVYNRCERNCLLWLRFAHHDHHDAMVGMFDLSLRINRSIQEISALIGMVSLEEARDLLNEHINLMTSVAALRGSLVFESELFQVFPAPVLLDTNVLLRATHALELPFRGVPLMMQTWVSIDNVVFRPLSIPLLLHPSPPPPPVVNEPHDHTAPVAPPCYTAARFHELAGMTIDIDDNSVRYDLQPDAVTLNTLVSNAFLLYLFNPTSFRPLDWSYEAGLAIGSHTHLLPSEREGVFLNSTTSALRVFLSYGKQQLTPVASAQAALDDQPPDTLPSHRRPLDIACAAGDSTFTFSVIATNRLTQAKKLVVSQAMRITLPAPAYRYGKLERHAQLSNDAVLCYSFDLDNHLQYVEFAIGFEPLLHALDVVPFLAT
ncbi:hypothetical protein DYB25_003110 [Aphanomyces astaci]|uniref:Uncharacterized protein n=1 Tax=Aphanomyces astaci TaxID=112090 RepID=A0A397DMP1_APHAT|nr:hypothetical protein DYB25_003110 [Aphanomyces astaci]RHY67877.1 hypothetical protein DYB30_003427 [Aphanomyces astaci]RHY83816.1 hypothetical protein DYB31_008575 [Aphanomyces astaci]RHZ06025.1 hypothetical protein DYB26_003882 [Aphanomyces astaci]